MLGSRTRAAGAVLAICALAVGLGPAAGPALAAPTAASGGGLSTIGAQGWRVQSSALVTQTGPQVSTPGFQTAGWLPVTPDDAGAPGTEIEALLQNGVCPHDRSFAIHQGPPLDEHNVSFSDNLQRCFGLEPGVGPDSIPEFQAPWWYRADFTPGLRPGRHAELVVNGIVGQADVWVNGVEVGAQATVQGSFTSYSFDITDLVRGGVNSVALELFPNDPTTMLTQDTVDWNQIAPDNSTGVQFPVQLHVSDALAAGNAYVTQNDAPDLSSAALTVRTDVTNSTAARQAGTVTAAITPPGGGSPISVSQAVTIDAGATQTVTFAPAAFPSLTIRHPRVWWPYQMGGQPLYTLQTSVSQSGVTSDTTPPVTFGIRTVTTATTGASALTPDGVRVFAVNGQRFVFRAGGFAEDLFLHYSSQDLANQISIIRSMGLNGIRTEGKEVPGDFYAQMDRAGILVDAGFQCCDSWQPDAGGRGVTAQAFRVMELSSFTIGKRLRDHPSVMNFSWSDSPPINEQEAASLAGFAQAGFQDPIISTAEYLKSAALGPSGEKEGPYDWVPPAYWYDSTHASHNAADNDPALTNVGGAWGFDSEQSAGDTVPTNDSIQRFLSAGEQAALWQQPAAHQYHTNYEPPGWIGYDFGTLFNLDQAMTKRYGQWSSLPQYVEEAQVQNYEDTRAQFEAFLDHSTSSPTPSTGTVYWQLNKGWPTLLWDLYNNDYDLAGSFFGARKANERLHVLYAYDNGTVTIDNLSGVTQPDVSVESRVRALDGTVLDDQVAGGVTLASQAVRNAVLTPRAPAATTPPAPAQTYFVELVLRQHGAVVDRNVYWLSTQPDVVDWTDSQGNPQALTSPTTSGLPQFADLRALQALPRATIAAVASTRSSGEDSVTSVTLTNTGTSAVGFFLRADVRRGDAGGRPLAGDDQVLPITWSDNDVTLWPGESQTLTATYRTSALGGAAPVVSVFGWNAPGIVAATGTATASAGDGTPLVSGEATPGPGPLAAPAGTPSPAAWTITSTPRGTFTQGDAAGSYTLTVTNSGRVATDGVTPVTLTDVVDPDLGLVSISGAGWTCDTSNDPTEVCTETGGPGGRPAVLGPGRSYPPLTLTVQVPATAGFGSQNQSAGLHVTNAVSVRGGSASQPGASITAETPVAGRPDLTADDAVASAFRQGDATDRYQITVINQGGAPTSGTIVAAVTAPAGETPVALYGSGWRCSLAAATCERTASLAGENGEAPPITLLVRVSPGAPASLTQSVRVSGGGERAPAATVDAPTPVLPASPAASGPPGLLAVTSTHAGRFAQGDAAGRYTLTVRNTGDRATRGAVTVTDALPAGLTATRMTGGGWTCSLQPVTLPTPIDTFEPLNTCSRGDALAAGASYPPVTLTASVSGDAQPSLRNVVTVSGGETAPASMTATDATAVDQRPDLTISARPAARGVPYAPFRRGDGAAQHDGYAITVVNAGFAATRGPVTVAVELPAGLRALSLSGDGRWTCSARTATCDTRPGAGLAAGEQASIALEVAVAGDAPSSVLPRISVSASRDADQAHDFVVVQTSVT